VAISACFSAADLGKAPPAFSVILRASGGSTFPLSRMHPRQRRLRPPARAGAGAASMLGPVQISSGASVKKTFTTMA
jgi:hypothetical protein